MTEQHSVSFCGLLKLLPGIPAQPCSPAWSRPSRLRWTSQPTAPGPPPSCRPGLWGRLGHPHGTRLGWGLGVGVRGPWGSQWSLCDHVTCPDVRVLLSLLPSQSSSCLGPTPTLWAICIHSLQFPEPWLGSDHGLDLLGVLSYFRPPGRGFSPSCSKPIDGGENVQLVEMPNEGARFWSKCKACTQIRLGYKFNIHYPWIDYSIDEYLLD